MSDVKRWAAMYQPSETVESIPATMVLAAEYDALLTRLAECEKALEHYSGGASEYFLRHARQTSAAPSKPTHMSHSFDVCGCTAETGCRPSFNYGKICMEFSPGAIPMKQGSL